MWRKAPVVLFISVVARQSKEKSDLAHLSQEPPNRKKSFSIFYFLGKVENYFSRGRSSELF